MTLTRAGNLTVNNNCTVTGGLYAATGSFTAGMFANSATIGQGQLQLNIVPGGAGGSPYGGSLINTFNSGGIPQTPLTYYTQQNNSGNNFASYLMLTPNPNSTYPYTAATNLGSGTVINQNIGLYVDSRMGVNGTLYLGNGVNSSASTLPTFSSLSANASGSIAVSGGLTTAKSTLDDGSGNATFAGNLALGSQNTMLSFVGGAAGAPTYGTRSSSTRILMYPGLSASSADFAFGMGSSAMWSSVPSTGSSFLWYGGTTNCMTLTGNGALSTIKTTLDDGSGNATFTGTVTSASSATGSILLASAAASASYFTNSAAGDGIVRLANPTGTMRLGVGTGASQVNITASSVSIPNLTLSSISNGTTSYVVPTNSDPRSLRLAAQPNYYVQQVNGSTGFYLSGTNILFNGPGAAYSGITTAAANSNIILPVAATYLVQVTLVGTVAASSTATLTLNALTSNVSAGGGTATAVNQSSSAVAMTLNMHAYALAVAASNSISFTVTNFSSLTSGSISIQQIMAV